MSLRPARARPPTAPAGSRLAAVLAAGQKRFGAHRAADISTWDDIDPGLRKAYNVAMQRMHESRTNPGVRPPPLDTAELNYNEAWRAALATVQEARPEELVPSPAFVRAEMQDELARILAERRAALGDSDNNDDPLYTEPKSKTVAEQILERRAALYSDSDDDEPLSRAPRVPAAAVARVAQRMVFFMDEWDHAWQNVWNKMRDEPSSPGWGGPPAKSVAQLEASARQALAYMRANNVTSAATMREIKKLRSVMIPEDDED